MLINEEPKRYLLSQTTVKRSLFSKKELTLYAVGDENSKPLTGYEYEHIEPYENGLTSAYTNYGPGIHHYGKDIFLIDLSGNLFLPDYQKKGYAIVPKGGAFTVSKGQKVGLANTKGKILIDPENNWYIKIIGDTVIYGLNLPGPSMTSRLGASKLEDGKLVPLIECKYNFVDRPWDSVIVAGRVQIDTSREIASLTKDRIIKKVTGAFMLFSPVTGKPLSNYVFGQLSRESDSTMIGIVYPNVRSEDIVPRSATFKESFLGTGGMDTYEKKEIKLNDRYEVMK